MEAQGNVNGDGDGDGGVGTAGGLVTSQAELTRLINALCQATGTTPTGLYLALGASLKAKETPDTPPPPGASHLSSFVASSCEGPPDQTPADTPFHRAQQTHAPPVYFKREDDVADVSHDFPPQPQHAAQQHLQQQQQQQHQQHQRQQQQPQPQQPFQWQQNPNNHVPHEQQQPPLSLSHQLPRHQQPAQQPQSLYGAHQPSPNLLGHSDAVAAVPPHDASTRGMADAVVRAQQQTWSGAQQQDVRAFNPSSEYRPHQQQQQQHVASGSTWCVEGSPGLRLGMPGGAAPWQHNQNQNHHQQHKQQHGPHGERAFAAWGPAGNAGRMADNACDRAGGDGSRLQSIGGGDFERQACGSGGASGAYEGGRLSGSGPLFRMKRPREDEAAGVRSSDGSDEGIGGAGGGPVRNSGDGGGGDDGGGGGGSGDGWRETEEQEGNRSELESLWRAVHTGPFANSSTGGGDAGEAEKKDDAVRRAFEASLAAAERAEEGGSSGKKAPCLGAQALAARMRRERVNARMRVLQALVPGAAAMTTESFLLEAAHYIRFLLDQLADIAGGMPAGNVQAYQRGNDPSTRAAAAMAAVSAAVKSGNGSAAQQLSARKLCLVSATKLVPFFGGGGLFDRALVGQQQDQPR